MILFLWGKREVYTPKISVSVGYFLEEPFSYISYFLELDVGLHLWQNVVKVNPLFILKNIQNMWFVINRT